MAVANGAAARDALDAVDYDPIDHLNALFSHAPALSAVARVAAALQRYHDRLDADVCSLVAARAASDSDSVRRIHDATAELAALSAHIEGVRARALAAERTIADMTADIKRLDRTKQNLTLSMTALKRLQMLTAAYEQLRGLIAAKQYRECAHLLPAVVQLMAHFKSFRSIDQIAALSKHVADLQRALLEQVCEDFEVAFARGDVPRQRTTLSEACHVLDALGDDARARLVTWYCNAQLREYRRVFRGRDEAGSLDNISTRYAWFHRLLKTYDAEHAALFPPSWRVNEMLANAFCENTRDDYKAILQTSMTSADGRPPDVNLLLSCLQETLDFEHALEKRFSLAESRTSMDTATSGDEKRHGGFGQAISEAFEPYLSIWVESQDRQLATLIPQYRQHGIRNAGDEFHAQLVLTSSTELFHHYRVTLAQCAKLSTGSRLEELSRTFAKYLDAYAQQVLFYFLSDKTGGPSVEDAIVILNTADYCYTTTNQLEERIKARIDRDLGEKLDLQSQADAFLGVASAAVRALVHKAEADCEPAWREMRSIPWGKMESVGDQSSYVSTLLQRVKDRSRDILRYLHKPQYARAYCDHLVDALTSSYITNIVAGRPISEIGSEQMLLDTYVLKKGLAELATLNSDPGTPVNAAFVKRVNQSTAKLDPILKTLQVRSSPPEGLVQAYLIHIRDCSEANFRKILELKGLTRKQDQNHLVELFNAHKASPANDGLQASNPLISSLNMSAPIASANPSTIGLVASKDSSSSPSLLAPPRFDAANFGNSLLNAAREAGDRFALTPIPGTSHAASRTTSSPDGRASLDGGGTGTLNENLKNFGRFFKKDGVPGFGGFGR